MRSQRSHKMYIMHGETRPELDIDLQRIAWITSFRWTWITSSDWTSLFWITT